jgi:pyruvate dehydrogenase E2 component (dihydrolipoamide acetyltransferase)
MWADGAVRLYRHVDLAVAVNTPAGLVAPVIRKADEKAVAVLNGEMRDLAERARAGRLRPDDYAGGTCTVSNLGMFGITSLYPIVNPPQACILGIGAVEERPVVRDHRIEAGMMVTATLSADHRVVDGATGAELLGAFRELIEDPWLLLL